MKSIIKLFNLMLIMYTTVFILENFFETSNIFIVILASTFSIALYNLFFENKKSTEQQPESSVLEIELEDDLENEQIIEESKNKISTIKTKENLIFENKLGYYNEKAIYERVITKVDNKMYSYFGIYYENMKLELGKHIVHNNILYVSDV